jgi:uncharacterized protein (TIGR03000 family)
MSTMSSSLPVDSYRVITDEPVGDKAGDSGEEIETPTPASDASTFFVPEDGVLLLVSVPTNATLLVNGAKTNSTGTKRQFVSRGLSEGKVYDYTVTMVIDRDGEATEETRTVSVSAGELHQVSFMPESPVTTLSLQVPADADVWLAGNATGSDGENRSFETTALAAGETWKDYEIRVVTKVDGREQIETKVIDLTAGDEVELSFSPVDGLVDASLIGATASTR